MIAQRGRIAALLIVVACVAAPVQSPDPGVSHERRAVPGTEAMAEVVTVDLTRMQFIPAIAAGHGNGTPRATVDALRRETGAWVMVNGTFFDPQGRALGLLRGAGTPASPLRSADWGVLEVTRGGRARIVHTRDYAASPDVEFAVQCGPRVVIDGRAPSLKPQRARRTALCLRDPTHVALVVVDERIEASDLGAWFAATPHAGGLGCRDALLLDGGPSTQLSARFPGVELEVAGGSPVPNGVGVVPRAPQTEPEQRG